MKTLIFILILVSFLQTTIIPINLVLLILILRAYIAGEKTDLYLGFAFGLLLSHLTSTVMGLQSIIFVILIYITHIFSKLPLAKSGLIVIPLIFFCSLVDSFILSLVMKQTLIIWPKIIIESLLTLPIFMLIRFWQERFISNTGVKLKI